MASYDRSLADKATRQQFEFTASVVWATLKPWLELHFGPKCDNYEFGCEACERWRLAEELLAYERVSSPQTLQKEIETLRECLRWREELLEKLINKQFVAETTSGNANQTEVS